MKAERVVLRSELDRQFGANLKRVRQLRRMSLATVGESVSLTYQQIQKYETGANGMALSTATLLCDVLNIRIPTLVEGLTMVNELPAEVEYNPDGMVLVNLAGIDPEVQTRLINLIEELKRSASVRKF